MPRPLEGAITRSQARYKNAAGTGQKEVHHRLGIMRMYTRDTGHTGVWLVNTPGCSWLAVAVKPAPAEKRMVHMEDIHCLQELARGARISQRQVKPVFPSGTPGERMIFSSSSGTRLRPKVNTKTSWPSFSSWRLLRENAIRPPADIRFVGVNHHCDAHKFFIHRLPQI